MQISTLGEKSFLLRIFIFFSTFKGSSKTNTFKVVETFFLKQTCDKKVVHSTNENFYLQMLRAIADAFIVYECAFIH